MSDPLRKGRDSTSAEEDGEGYVDAPALDPRPFVDRAPFGVAPPPEGMPLGQEPPLADPPYIDAVLVPDGSVEVAQDAIDPREDDARPGRQCPARERVAGDPPLPCLKAGRGSLRHATHFEIQTRSRAG